jgi:hypothetical protein
MTPATLLQRLLSSNPCAHMHDLQLVADDAEPQGDSAGEADDPVVATHTDASQATGGPRIELLARQRGLAVQRCQPHTEKGAGCRSMTSV